MSEPKDPAHEEMAARFLRHLNGTADEADRQELERAVLEDDELFDQLSDLESELVDAYVDGELDQETTRSLASLVAASPRLQAKAETTLALSSRQNKLGAQASRRHSQNELGAQASRLHSRGTKCPTRLRWLVLNGGIVVALALLGWLFLRTAAMQATVRDLRTENIELQDRAEALEATVEQLEASNRTLTRRMARLEAERRN